MIVENTQDLTLTQRIERMLVCASRIERFSRKLREELHLGNLPFDDNPYDYYDTSSVGKSYHVATNDGTDSYVFTRDADRAAQSERARAEAESAGTD